MKLVFDERAWQDFTYWLSADPKLASRIVALIADTVRSPFRGLGKPEPLRGNLSGFWSRRIDDQHRLVYRVIGKGADQRLEIAQCRFHY